MRRFIRVDLETAGRVRRDRKRDCDPSMHVCPLHARRPVEPTSWRSNLVKKSRPSLSVGTRSAIRQAFRRGPYHARGCRFDSAPGVAAVVAAEGSWPGHAEAGCGVELQGRNARDNVDRDVRGPWRFHHAHSSDDTNGARPHPRRIQELAEPRHSALAACADSGRGIRGGCVNELHTHRPGCIATLHASSMDRAAEDESSAAAISTTTVVVIESTVSSAAAALRPRCLPYAWRSSFRLQTQVGASPKPDLWDAIGPPRRISHPITTWEMPS
jgi:hypothetical protein